MSDDFIDVADGFSDPDNCILYYTNGESQFFIELFDPSGDSYLQGAVYDGSGTLLGRFQKCILCYSHIGFTERTTQLYIKDLRSNDKNSPVFFAKWKIRGFSMFKMKWTEDVGCGKIRTGRSFWNIMHSYMKTTEHPSVFAKRKDSEFCFVNHSE